MLTDNTITHRSSPAFLYPELKFRKPPLLCSYRREKVIIWSRRIALARGRGCGIIAVKHLAVAHVFEADIRHCGDIPKVNAEACGGIPLV